MSDWKEMTLEQRIHLIKAVYREGMSAREIAAAIGTSKGSIIGLYSRHKDALSDAPIGLHKKTVTHARASNVKIDAIIIPIRSFRREPFNVTLFENTGCMCPVNDGGPYLFCGHGKAHGSYCQHHHVRSMGRGTEGERRAHKIGERHV